MVPWNTYFIPISYLLYWCKDFKNMQKIELPQEHFKGKPKQGKIMLPVGLKWLCHLNDSSEIHRDISISCTFLDKIGIKKHSQDFFLYSMTPKIVFESFHLKYWRLGKYFMLKILGSIRIVIFLNVSIQNIEIEKEF